MENELITKAYKALKGSYSPYSNFKVGACLLTKNGKSYCGANVENASYGLTVCAERTAVFKAVNSGEKDFLAIAIISNSKKDFCYPCGACLQVLAEFSSDMKIIVCKSTKEYKIFTIKELLPHNF
ncbi:MAG: cytidine deaminase [Clostridia bacterium]|nr:cytidine deaminase [Clostridia bacterium]